MPSGLHSLPAAKRRQLQAITEAVREAADVELVILFGSFARGDWVEDPAGGYFSDYDLLVVVKSRSLVEKHELWGDLEQRLQPLADPTEVNLIVHDIKDVNQQLEKGQYFFSDIVREGIVIHDSGRVSLAEPRDLDTEERRKIAQAHFEQWLGSADQFYAFYESGVEKGWYNIAAFHLHQAAERLYVTALLTLSGYKPKTHNLTKLGRLAGDLHRDLRGVFPENTADDRRLFTLLKKAYVEARYSSKYAITREELETLAERVRDLRGRVERVCRERLGSGAG